MRVPLKWLTDYVSTDWTPEHVAERLTMAGLEIGAIERVGASWDGVQVALVTDVQPHPNADRLRLVTVKLGADSATVVCGAPNVAVGQKVAFASVGARLVDGHSGEVATLKPAKIRGILSAGMVCSEKELGLSDDHEGTVELPLDAPIGVALQDYLGDVLLDLELTPNRPDCLSVIGVARELAALGGMPLTVPSVAYASDQTQVDSLIKVSVENGDDCHRYCATVVRDVKLGPSPAWMQARLKACGMRPISNIVDITNYVMLEYGQPLHAFDYDRIARKEIVVRRARAEEVFTTLDDVERKLSPEVLLITDGERPVGIAGIMGGSNTEVSDTTSTVLLEAATFNRAVIRRGSAFLGLRTEASLRFDKGLHPNLAITAVRRATQLLVELCGGRAVGGVSDTYPCHVPLQRVTLPVLELKRLTGVEVPREQARQILEHLGYEFLSASDQATEFQVPYWRGDVSGPADLVEDVIRVLGYDRIPVGTPRFTTAAVSVPADLWDFKAHLRRLIAGAGFQEVLTYSLVSRDKLAQLTPGHPLAVRPLGIANPMSKDQEYLRTSLRASLLDAISRNRRREQAPARVFELSRVYLPQAAGLPEERETLCAILCGTGEPVSWHHAERRVDFYDAKGAVEFLLLKCGVQAHFVPSQDAGLFPGRQADVVVDGETIGVVGQIHPTVARTFEVDSDTLVFELDVARVMRHARQIAEYEPLSRFPSSERDMALVVDEAVTYARIVDIISGFGLVADTSLFDVYRGEQIPAGKKSFAVRLVFQAPDRTLTDAEVQGILDKILARLQSGVGAVLRR